MKILKVLIASSFLVLLNQPISAEECTPVLCENTIHWENHHSPFGNSAFNVTDPSLWYTITTNSYPDMVSLSQGRNKGTSKGSVYLSPTGFTIGEDGNYWVNITAIMQNPGMDPILIPVFLVRDETFDPTDPSTLGGVVTLDSGGMNTLQGSGAITNVTAGTRLSLVATNAGYPMPQPVTVVAWSISLFKLP